MHKADPAPLDLDALEALEKAATPIGWFVVATGMGNKKKAPTICHAGDDLNYVASFADFMCFHAPPKNLENANFIAALRNAAPALIEAARERDALKAERDAYRAAKGLPPKVDVPLKTFAEFAHEHGMKTRDELETELASLRAALETAQAALEPFARPLLNDQYLHDIQVIFCETRNEETQLELRVSDFRRARAALDAIKARTE